MITNKTDCVSDSYKAAGAVTQYRAVKPYPASGDEYRAQVTDNNDPIANGIAQDTAADAESMRVVESGNAYAELGGTVAVGNFLRTDTAGKFRAIAATGTPTTYYFLAWAKEAGAAAEVKRVFVARGAIYV